MVPLDANTESLRVTRVVEDYPDGSHHIDYTPKGSFKGINVEAKFNQEYPHLTVIQSASPLSKPVFKLKSTKKFFKTLKLEKDDLTWDTWYETCIPSLFQPSEFAMRYINPFLEKIKDRYVIGIHIRMAGNYSLWKDSHAYLTMEDITKRLGDIDIEMMSHPNPIIFLTTDSVIIEQQFTEKYSNRVLMANYLPQTLTGKQSTEAGLMRVIIELYMLSKSNVLFLTSRSTLSRVALAMNAMNPKVQYFYSCLFLAPSACFECHFAIHVVIVGLRDILPCQTNKSR